MNGYGKGCGKELTKRKNDLVKRMLLEVSEAGEFLATERTEHAVVEGTLETLCTKRLYASEQWVPEGRWRRTCWQGVVIGW